MIYLTGYNYLHNHHQQIYVSPPAKAAVVKIKAENKAVVRGSSWCDRFKRRGWVSSMACRQIAATAWDQTHPVHGGAFFFARGGLSTESRPSGGLRNWEQPRAGNDGGQGHSVVVVDRWGASTPHMGRARGLGATWLM